MRKFGHFIYKEENLRRAGRSVLIAALAVALLLGLSALARRGMPEREVNTAYRTGRVVELIDREEVYWGEMRDLTVTFTVDLGDETVTATQTISDGIIAGDRREVAVGDRITLMNNAGPGMAPNFVFTGYVRLGGLLALGAVFVVAMLIFGRTRGLAALIALGLTCAAVFGCFVPAVLAGRNIYLWLALTCGYITVSTLTLIGGAGRKSLCAIIGCLGGSIVAAVVMALTDLSLHMTGFLDENSAYLLYLDTPAPIDLRALLYAAVLIGALGAVMDIAVDIASSLHEIAAKVEAISVGALFRSGITIGRDLIVTMANTLVLAYIGSSISTVLLLAGGSGTSLFYLLNQEQIVFEILQALVGSCGILAALPLTALVSALRFGRRPEVRDEYAEALAQFEEKN